MSTDKQTELETNRLEAFSDGVIAVLITIMVLELRPPESGSLNDLLHESSPFLVYVLSFIFIGIYWNNHHHLLHAAKRSSASIMWANLHLLLWISMIPFVTEWVGEHPREHAPAFLYGVVTVLCAIAYTILTIFIKKTNSDTAFAELIGKDTKGKISVVLYLVATACAFIHPFISYTIFVVVAAIWFIPDKRLA